MNTANNTIMDLLGEFFDIFTDEFEKLKNEYDELKSDSENKEEYVAPECKEKDSSYSEYVYLSDEDNIDVANKEISDTLDDFVFKVRTHNLPTNLKVTFDYKVIGEPMTFEWNTYNDRFECIEYNVFYSELCKEFFNIDAIDCEDCNVNEEKDDMCEKRENFEVQDYACPSEKEDENEVPDAPDTCVESNEESFVVEPDEPVEIPKINDYLGCKHAITAANLFKKLNNWRKDSYNDIKIPLLIGLDKVFSNNEYAGLDNNGDAINTLVVKFIDIITYTERKIDLENVLDIFNESDFAEVVKDRYGFTGVEFEGNTVKTLKMYCTLE